MSRVALNYIYNENARTRRPIIINKEMGNKINPYLLKKDFPVFQDKVDGRELIYLDNAATTQKPYTVIEAVRKYSQQFHGNPHRGAHYLSVKATELYDQARQKVREFIKARSAKEIIFTRNTTEAINLVAYSYGMNFIDEGDEIVLSIAEHHSNILPWQQVARSRRARLKYMYLDEDGRLSKDEVKSKITERTKLVCLTHMSNVLGTIFPVREIIEYAHQKGALVLIDGAQGIPHVEVDVQELDADFYVFSGHKMLGPMGIGVLYAKEELLEMMPPFLRGGDMIEYVTEDTATFAPLPEKFEAGTQNVEGAVGLAAAIDYLNSIGMDKIHQHEQDLTAYALERMQGISYLTLYGPTDLEERGGIISFNVAGIHPHDLASIVDLDGIALRAGHHCAQPLMKYLQLVASCRISFYLYNTKEDIDQLIDSLDRARSWFSNGTK